MNVNINVFYLALWLRWREWCVLLLHALLLGLSALGQVLVAEFGQEAFPALHPQVGVFGQLPFDHQRLIQPSESMQRVGGGAKIMKMLFCQAMCLYFKKVKPAFISQRQLKLS